MEHIKDDSTLGQVLAACEAMAEETNGAANFTIYRFMTGWKVVLGTPRFLVEEDFVIADKVPGRMTFVQALLEFLRNPVDPSDEKLQADVLEKFRAENASTLWAVPDEGGE